MVRPLYLFVFYNIYATVTQGSRVDKKQRSIVHHVPFNNNNNNNNKNNKPIQGIITGAGPHNQKLQRVSKNRFRRALSSKNKNKKTRATQQQTKQRIVILAGPHKTASTSIQRNIYQWTSTNPKVIPDWSWPIPNEILECYDKTKSKFEWYQLQLHTKGFYPLGAAITEDAKIAGTHAIFRCYNNTEVLGLYRDAMEKKWLEGYNLVIGTEALDFLVTHNEPGFKNLLSVLPLRDGSNGSNDDLGRRNGIEYWGADKKDVTVIVKFRAPRVQHLVSLFHQCCAKKKKWTFEEFLNKRMLERKLHTLDSLELSEIFLKHGFHVVLVDMGGIKHEGYDISNVVACDVMRVSCTEINEIVSMSDEDDKISPEVANVKHDLGKMGGVTEVQLDKMEQVIRKYDCNHHHVLKHENLTVLYDFDLDYIRKGCSKLSKIIPKNRNELALKLKWIVNNVDQNRDYADTSMDETSETNNVNDQNREYADTSMDETSETTQKNIYHQAMFLGILLHLMSSI